MTLAGLGVGIPVLVVALVVAACGSTPATTVPASVAVATGSAIQIQQAPANLGCDAMGVDYRRVTFRIDPAAAEQVAAVTDTGRILRTFWSAGFRGGPAAERVVVDPAGAVVAVDGEVLAIPRDAWPRLHGYFVCPSPDALYVLTPDPS